MVLQCDFLGPQVFLDGDRIVSAALNGRVIRNHNSPMTLDGPHTRDNPGARRFIAVHPIGCERTEFQEWCSRIEQRADSIPYEHFAARGVTLPRLFATAQSNRVVPFPEFRHKLHHGVAIGL